MIKKNREKCSIEGCDRPAFIEKHRLCRAHLQNYYRKGEPGIGKIRAKKKHTAYEGKKDNGRLQEIR